MRKYTTMREEWRDGLLDQGVVMARGRIYVLSSPSQAGFVKVGKTARTPQERAAELDSTVLALPLEVEYEIVIDEFDAVELETHSILETQRARGGREWFRCEPEAAVLAIKEAATRTTGAKIVGEIDYRGLKDKADKLSQKREKEFVEKNYYRDSVLIRDLPGLGGMIKNLEDQKVSDEKDERGKRNLTVAIAGALFLYMQFFEKGPVSDRLSCVAIGGCLAAYWHHKLNAVRRRSISLPTNWAQVWSLAVEKYGWDGARSVALKEYQEALRKKVSMKQ